MDDRNTALESMRLVERWGKPVKALRGKKNRIETEENQ